MKKLIFAGTLFFASSMIFQDASAQVKRIIGGKNASKTAYPWMVAIGDANFQTLTASIYCGGTVINDEWILTAAHCVTIDENSSTPSSPSQVDVFLDFYSINNPEPGYKRIHAKKIIIHPTYDPVSVDGDLALIQLAQPVTNTPITLPEQGDTTYTKSNLTNTVLGWGYTQPTSSMADTLQEVDVKIISNYICNGPTVYEDEVTENMLCAGFLAGGKDACSGDSGGPLIFKDVNNDKSIQTGIVSWGGECAAPNEPGVYTRVSKYTDWILSNAEVTSIKQSRNIGVEKDGVLHLSQTSAGEYNIYNIEGKLLNKGIIDDNRVNLNTLTEGLYLIVIQDGSQVISGKFYKN